MSNPSKQKGTTFETAVVNYLIDNGVSARRVALTGKEDHGDLHTMDGEWVIQCKNTRRIDLAGACDAVLEQRDNEQRARMGQKTANHYPRAVAIIKRERKGTGDAYAVMPLHEFIDLMHDLRQGDG